MRTRITITGGDSAHRAEMIGMQSRVLVFPDGLPRHFTLSNWQWEVFDRALANDDFGRIDEAMWLHAHQTWVEDSFNAAAGVRPDLRKQLAQSGLDHREALPDQLFDLHLRYAVPRAIEVNMPRVMPGLPDPLRGES